MVWSLNKQISGSASKSADLFIILIDPITIAKVNAIHAKA